jgi:hypothetical protein
MAQTVTFQRGGPKRPSGIVYDDGFSKVPRRQATKAELAKYLALKELATYGGTVSRFLPIPLPKSHMLGRLADLPDGLAAFRHYLEGSGTARGVAYDDYISDDPSGRVLLLNARFLARQGAEQLYRDFIGPPASGMVSFPMNSNAIAVNTKDTRFYYPQTENWQKTLGAHFIWISAQVYVRTTASDANPVFQMQMTIHAEDLYNFNPGQKDIASKTPDSSFGVFEEVGLAKQYMNYGTFARDEWWTGPTVTLAQVQYNTPGAGTPVESR